LPAYGGFFSNPVWYRQPALTSVYRLGAVLAGSVSLLVLASAGSAGDIEQLHARAHALAAREHAALLDLYALDSRLEQARSSLTEIESRLAQLRGQQARVRLQLTAARRTLAVAQHQLGDQVRALYEYDQPGVLEVVLGASSLDEVITGLDSLSRTARTTSDVVSQTLQARRSVSRLARSLAERVRELGSLRREAAARASLLATARAQRAAYVSRLAAERRLTAQQIVSLEVQASVAQARASTANAVAQVTPTVAGFVAQPQDPASRPASGHRLTVLATGYALTGSTATGLPVGPGIVAVDPTVIPLGTRMEIPGYGAGIAADTGPAIQGLRVDLWFPTQAQALAWGWRTVTVVLR
jgi:3D (Asp-Asp-Asp) domain-containing protein